MNILLLYKYVLFELSLHTEWGNLSPKTVIATSGFTYVYGCRPLDSSRQPQTYIKPEAAITVLGLLMMSDVAQNMLNN